MRGRRFLDARELIPLMQAQGVEEALEVADQVVVMNGGRIEQVGDPGTVFHHPNSEFVMRFMGEVNSFSGRLESGQVLWGAAGGGDDRDVVLARPHDLEVHLTSPGPASVAGVVERVHAAGPESRIEVRTEQGGLLLVHLSHNRLRELGLSAGVNVHVSVNAARVFPPMADRAGQN